MERNQYKERLMDLQEAVRWTEMIRASKAAADPSAGPHLNMAGIASAHQNNAGAGATLQQGDSDHAATGQPHHEHHKKRSALWKLYDI